MTDAFEKSAIPRGIPMLPVTPVTLAMETMEISFGLLKNLFAIIVVHTKAMMQIRR